MIPTSQGRKCNSAPHVKRIPLTAVLALSRVGDMFKFGRSTRMYILGGPTELMPEEGLTKKQMLTMKALEVWHSRDCDFVVGMGAYVRQQPKLVYCGTKLRCKSFEEDM